MTITNQDDLLKGELVQLRQEHRTLDARIAEAIELPNADRLALQRLKKQKLLLKDRIARIEDQIYPDIIA